MAAKEKIIGLLIVLVGAFPLLLKMKSIQDSLSQYPVLQYLNAGEPVYQIIIIILGVFLLLSFKPKDYNYRYPPRR